MFALQSFMLNFNILTLNLSKTKIMKKLIMLSVIGIMTLSSFGKKDNFTTKPVTMLYWSVTCGGVPSGGFWCSGCTQESALIIAKRICSGQ